MNIGEGISGALFDGEEHKHRFSLWRIWDRAKRALLFIGLNPSTASGLYDDPTIVRLACFAKAWGYGSLYAGNLFSIVSSDPEVLYMETSWDPIGGPNDKAILKMREVCSTVMVGWGAWGRHFPEQVAYMLSLLGDPIYCIKTTRMGEPMHPLYLPKDSKLREYHRQEAINGR